LRLRVLLRQLHTVLTSQIEGCFDGAAYAAHGSPNIGDITVKTAREAPDVVAVEVHGGADVFVTRRNALNLVAPNVGLATDNLLDRHLIPQEFEHVHVANLLRHRILFTPHDLLTVDSIPSPPFHKFLERPATEPHRPAYASGLDLAGAHERPQSRPR
jgi:hypothetical protein